MVVWVVISSYRNDKDVIRILGQVRASLGKIVDKILVVDSEGTGMIPDVFKDSGWSDVIYRCYNYNLGSGANLRERLCIAAEGGADYAYAINHDGYFDAEVVTSLLKAAESVDSLGAAYPLSYFTNLGLYNLTGTRELPLSAKLVPSPPCAPLLDVFWSSSNGALYSMGPVRRGIVPWDTMWMAWEDLEYGWRLSNHGYRQVIVRDAVFRDDYEYARTWLGRTASKPAWRTYYQIRNLILAIRRSRDRPVYYLIAAYRFLLECGLIVLAKEDKWTRLRFLWAGANDGIKGIEGRRPSLDQR